MSGLTCNSCNTEFKDDSDQKLHYKSEWHRYNLKRKVAGVPGVTEALFLARQAALAQERHKSNESPMLYSCGLCGKGYKSEKAHAEHLKSRTHMMRASEGASDSDGKAIIKPLPQRVVNKPPPRRLADISADDDESEDEWVEVDSDDDLLDDAANSLTDLNVDENADNDDMDEDDDDVVDLDPSCCFMCDKEHKTLENCMVHMHKHHGFFIPDVEYLKDPKGLLTYLGLKVKRDYLCLYCNDRCHPFSSLEAVRKHMVAKNHCKVHYGDDDDEEEVELEEFYDYTSSYVDEQGKQLVVSGDADNNIELSDGSELVITKLSGNKKSTRTLGSREYLRYYRQKPRPSPANNVAVTAELAARYRSMGLATVQSREQLVRMKVLKQMNRSGVEQMRSKMGMKSNVIRNLPNNVTY
ncbi:cytoplasmic 60S subunit biogenesis factor REI1 protein [Trifolium repens]|nr:cytoplasmic 60S subunit biogenesis factor REI1 protein [Trifolium repens]